MSEIANLITFDQFIAVELRCGQIMAVAEVDWSDKLIQLTVDFGPELGTKIVLAGLKKWFLPTDFIAKKAVFVTNLPERKMGPGVSQAMILAADALGSESQDTGASNQVPSVLWLPDSVPAGVRIH